MCLSLSLACLTACNDDNEVMETVAGMEKNGPWGVVYSEGTDYTAPADFCVKQPAMAEGYCTYACTNNQECTDLESPKSWTYNTLNFTDGEDILSNWCGPQSEVTDFPGVIVECP